MYTAVSTSPSLTPVTYSLFAGRNTDGVRDNKCGHLLLYLLNIRERDDELLM
jgi:hypothetical protein